MNKNFNMSKAELDDVAMMMNSIEGTFKFLRKGTLNDDEQIHEEKCLMETIKGLKSFLMRRKLMTDFDAITTITLPAGKYFYGDPCYVLSRDDFDKLYEGELQNCALLKTRHGDGCYGDNTNNTLYVDSGHLGLVNATYFNNEKINKHNFSLEELGEFVTFDKKVKVTIERGRMSFNGRCLDTND